MASPSSESAAPDNIKDLLTCSMCSRTLSEPRILPCFHNFCKACLGQFPKLGELLSEGNEALKNICEVMKSLEKNAKTAKDQIEEQKENILKIVSDKLDKKAKKMNKEVDKVKAEMHSELSKQRDEIKEYLKKLQASVSLPRNLPKRGNPKKLIDEKIEKLRSEKPKDLEAVNHGDIRFIADDIGKINVDEVVGKFGHVEGDISRKWNLEKTSSILDGEIDLAEKLREFVEEKIRWKLLYRAPRDGWRAQDFHRHCDNKGPTVVLVEANDCIFGGYTDQHWDTSGGNKRPNSSFLFSLRNKDDRDPFTANIKPREKHEAIQKQEAIPCGPCFGNDLHIFHNPNAKQSYSDFGHRYQLPDGYHYGTERAKKLLTGQVYFYTTKIEVYN